MNKKILFVVEGPSERKEIRRNLTKYLNLCDSNYEIITYKTSIHELQDFLTKEENQDLSLTAALIKSGKVKVDEIKYQLDSTFSNIYLVFDFDPQYQKYNKEELSYMAKRFNNETEEGKLLLNYPMYESLFDINDINNENEYLHKKIPVVFGDYYKNLVKKTTCFRNENGHPYSHIDKIEDFVKIAKFNLDKYLFILSLNEYSGLDEELLLKYQIESLEQYGDFYVINTLSILYYDYN